MIQNLTENLNGTKLKLEAIEPAFHFWEKEAERMEEKVKMWKVKAEAWQEDAESLEKEAQSWKEEAERWRERADSYQQQRKTFEVKTTLQNDSTFVDPSTFQLLDLLSKKSFFDDDFNP